MKPYDLQSLSPLEAAARALLWACGDGWTAPNSYGIEQLIAELRAADRANEQAMIDAALPYALAGLAAGDAEAQTINGAAHSEQAEGVSTDSVVEAIASEGVWLCRPAEVAADAAAPPYTPDTVAKVVTSGKFDLPAAAPPSTFVPGVGFLPTAKQASPEPVAWLYHNTETGGRMPLMNRIDADERYTVKPLYVSPPESEADALLRRWCSDERPLGGWGQLLAESRAYLKGRGK